jgi:hypothetical protein
MSIQCGIGRFLGQMRESAADRIRLLMLEASIVEYRDRLVVINQNLMID